MKLITIIAGLISFMAITVYLLVIENMIAVIFTLFAFTLFWAFLFGIALFIQQKKHKLKILYSKPFYIVLFVIDILYILYFIMYVLTGKGSSEPLFHYISLYLCFICFEFEKYRQEKHNKNQKESKQIERDMTVG